MLRSFDSSSEPALVEANFLMVKITGILSKHCTRSISIQTLQTVDLHNTVAAHVGTTVWDSGYFNRPPALRFPFVVFGKVHCSSYSSQSEATGSRGDSNAGSGALCPKQVLPSAAI